MGHFTHWWLEHKLLECEETDEKLLRSEHDDLSLPLENSLFETARRCVGLSFPLFIIPCLAFEVHIFVLFSNFFF